jgi:hypothetical protein
VAAMTANPTPACAARPDTPPSTNAPPELLPDDVVVLPAVTAAATPEAVGVVESDAETTRGVLAGAFDDSTAEEDTTTALERGAAEVPFVLLPVVVLPTRAPVPHGIAWPSGWFWLGAGTVLPEASEMAKRPVHDLLDEAGEENW